MKLLSLFSGIGAFEKALTNIGVEYELVGFSEIDKWAIESYSAIHDVSTELNLGDVAEIDAADLPQADVVTYGFPCQDISVAGLGAGVAEGTRSGLLYEAERVIEHVKPKYAIAENVKNLIGKRHREDFDKLLERLEGYGYNNYWEVLNAKEFGIPQNRERVFIVSIRKDIDDGSFTFPQGFDSGLRLKDMLLDEVEGKYYIENDGANKLVEHLMENKMPEKPDRNTMVGGLQKNQAVKTDGISVSITSAAGMGGGHQPIVTEPSIVASRGRNPENPSDRNAGSPTQQRLEINEQGTTNTLTTVQKDNWVLEPNEQLLVGRIAEYSQGSRVYDEGGIATTQTAGGGGIAGPTGMYLTKRKNSINQLGMLDMKGNEQTRRVYGKDGISPTLNTMQGGNREPKVYNDYRIRKLTPQECWRLMGFEDGDYWAARTRLEDKFYNGGDRSNSQMYKQAGNSIVVDVLEAIFKNLEGTKQ